MANAKVDFVTMEYQNDPLTLNRHFDDPDSTREYPLTRVDFLGTGRQRIARLTCQPGWRWSACIGAAIGASTCQQMHTNYIVSGRIRTRLDDGTEFESSAGSLTRVPPGHDGWVLGDEALVMIDFTGNREG